MSKVFSSEFSNEIFQEMSASMDRQKKISRTILTFVVFHSVNYHFIPTKIK